MIRILFAFIVAAPVSAWAAQVCMEVPDGVTYEAIQTNFDGSITITRPKVLVNGDYVFLFPGDHTSVGFCKYMGRVLVQSQLEYKTSSETMATLDSEGRFGGVTSSEKLIKRISCRDDQSED